MNKVETKALPDPLEVTYNGTFLLGSNQEVAEALLCAMIRNILENDFEGGGLSLISLCYFLYKANS
jgi:hypothetical protein